MIRKIFNKYLLFYIISILVFGLLYCFYWTKSTDSFIINKELNLNPLEEDFRGINSTEQEDLLEFSTKLSQVLNNLDSLRNLHSSALRDKRIYQEILDSLYSINDSIREINLNRYFEDRVSNSKYNLNKMYLNSQIDSIKKRQQLVSALDSIGMTIEIARIETEIAKNQVSIEYEKSEIINYQLRNMKSFGHPEITKQRDSLRTLQDAAMMNEMKLIDQIFHLESNLRQLRREYRSLRNTKLKLSDFIYFSAANASTITYGEIIPNNSISRYTILAQVLICLILFGGYLAELFSIENHTNE